MTIRGFLHTLARLLECVMIQFELYVKPLPQKQTRWSRTHSYDPSKEYKESLIWQMKPYAPTDPILGPISLGIIFYMQAPASVSKTKRRLMLEHVSPPIVRPDIDNLAYVVTNAMKHMFYQDDSQIVDLNLKKRYAEKPRISITLTPYEVKPYD